MRGFRAQASRGGPRILHGQRRGYPQVPRHRPLHGGRSPFTGTRGDHDLSSHPTRRRRGARGRRRGLGIPAGPLLLQAGHRDPHLLAHANLGEWCRPGIDALVLVSAASSARRGTGICSITGCARYAAAARHCDGRSGWSATTRMRGSARSHGGDTGNPPRKRSAYNAPWRGSSRRARQTAWTRTWGVRLDGWVCAGVLATRIRIHSGRGNRRVPHRRHRSALAPAGSTLRWASTTVSGFASTVQEFIGQICSRPSGSPWWCSSRGAFLSRPRASRDARRTGRHRRASLLRSRSHHRQPTRR